MVKQHRSQYGAHSAPFQSGNGGFNTVQSYPKAGTFVPNQMAESAGAVAGAW